MADTLFYRQVETSCEWLVFNSQGQLLSRGVADEPDFDHDGPSVCVVSGFDVLNTRAAVPSRQYRQILQAAPYVVEDNLAMNVEDCFFALGDHNDRGEVAVAVVASDLMETWAAHIDGLSVDVRVLLAEHELVKGDADASVVVDGERLHLNSTESGRATICAGELGLVLSAMGGETIVDIAMPEEHDPAIDLQLNELEAAGVDVRRTTFTESSFEHLCRSYNGSEINLLQGIYRRTEKRTEGSSLWRSVTILAACAILIHIGTLVAKGWYLQRQADAFYAETMAIYKKTFPNDRNVRDIRRRWNSHLGKQESSDGNDFMALFAQSARELTGAGLSLSTVNFNENRGDLVLQVLGRRSEELVQYAQKLNSAGLDAEIGTITQEEGGVRGSIRVRGAS